MDTILLVDDEETIVDVCRRYLEKEGFRVLTANNGEVALQLYKSEHVDLLVVDIMMPKMDGHTLVMEIQELEKDTPFLYLSALTQEKERLYGLTLGADDYMSKPFSPRELVLRVKNILRRTKRSSEPETLKHGLLFLDKSKRLVLVNQEELELTIKEFDLLWLLASENKRVFSKSELLERVWGYEYDGDANTINVHIHHLREKLQANDEKVIFIKTVWGLGYKFEMAVES
ncbi:response regulator transcription factor [Listeria seeligeri]|uniref:response regulator transcription factor n=1 Tax=Listeria seeligeri TaxID=1640 RepID=UPI001624A1E7|nr:response regulator transcription factor [Listeria seeligeri]MBC1472865.1 response regulator transcription factor [Listeria seeligeri]MBC1791419.1 response regulator transcription factor [Listeria seeligeri]MBC1846536.1 response regulator transcription factor [Listeria seeligeri]